MSSKSITSQISSLRTVKILLIGNSGVGKSSILVQFSDKKFAHNYYNTIGVDYKIKHMKTSQGQKVKAQIWDTAGQDRFKTITSSYYRGAHGIIIAYDITDAESFENVKSWLEQIEKYTDQKTKIYIVGNKIDLDEKRCISEEQGKRFADQIGFSFKQTSARSGTNIDEVFQELVDEIALDQSILKSSKQQASNLEGNKGGKQIKKLMKDNKKEEEEEKSGCC